MDDATIERELNHATVLIGLGKAKLQIAQAHQSMMDDDIDDDCDPLTVVGWRLDDVVCASMEISKARRHMADAVVALQDMEG